MLNNKLDGFKSRGLWIFRSQKFSVFLMLCAIISQLFVKSDLNFSLVGVCLVYLGLSGLMFMRFSQKTAGIIYDNWNASNQRWIKKDASGVKIVLYKLYFQHITIIVIGLIVFAVSLYDR